MKTFRGWSPGERPESSDWPDAGLNFGAPAFDPATYAPEPAVEEPAPGPQAPPPSDFEESVEASFANFGDAANADAPSPRAIRAGRTRFRHRR